MRCASQLNFKDKYLSTCQLQLTPVIDLDAEE